ncbi:hypothetical protein OH76DRAFT_256728 [Lentinus brumalis]|uniref:Uncharacterized protein n=1 Tax=Lentinus brumalis TaxID=2498619 RepID=A0A371CLB6_9APHY|nr:hypothetical protein OH76DRAFT_256728 [Polyporus brumalis]
MQARSSLLSSAPVRGTDFPRRLPVDYVKLGPQLRLSAILLLFLSSGTFHLSQATGSICSCQLWDGTPARSGRCRKQSQQIMWLYEHSRNIRGCGRTAPAGVGVDALSNEPVPMLYTAQHAKTMDFPLWPDLDNLTCAERGRGRPRSGSWPLRGPLASCALQRRSSDSQPRRGPDPG